MAGKKKSDAEKTRTQIIDAAEILFFEKGVSNTSLCEIADYAGVTRGAIYWHFRNKVELFHAMHMRVALPLETMRLETLGESDPILALRDFWIRSIMQIAGDNRRRRVIEILFRRCEYVEEFEDAARRIQDWSNRIIDTMIRIFRDAEAKGLLTEGMPPDIAAFSTYSLVTGILHSWMIRQDIDDVALKAPEIITMFFRSVRRPRHDPACLPIPRPERRSPALLRDVV
ncbi:MAG: TetR family transcriptional regulator [Telmatospirillum sp.]|nr:TetR family transcriptional regulator [Telmatospirillum sp.]